MAELSLSDNYRAVQTLTGLKKLIVLDDVWTQYLETARQIPRTDVEVLRSLTDEMQSLLKDSVDEAEWLRGLISGNERGIEEAALDVLRQSRLSDEDKEAMRRIFDDSGGVIAMAHATIESIISRGPKIGEEIAAKMRRIEEGGFVPGDMRVSERRIVIRLQFWTAVFAYLATGLTAYYHWALDCLERLNDLTSEDLLGEP